MCRLNVLVVMCALFAGPAAAASGEDIFHGDGNGAVRAAINGTAVSGSRFACASCHGRDGKGRTEGDAAAPDITRGPGSLDRAGVTQQGRIRPAYDLAGFRAALEEGVTPDGRSLSPRMPRYQMEEAEIAALWTYLEVLPAKQATGVRAGELVFSIAAPDAFAAEAEALRALLQGKIGNGLRQGNRLALKTEQYGPGPDGQWPCPGDGAVAVVMPFVDPERQILAAARRCGVPVLFPLADLVGNENPLDVRSDRASLLLQWKALRATAGPDASVILPERLFNWERQALEFAGIQAKEGSGTGIFLPFGLNRSMAKRPPAEIYAPAYGSAASLQTWRAEGHRLHLSVTTQQDGLPFAEALTSALADLLERAAESAGPRPTRAWFMETIGQLPAGEGTAGLDYRVHRLTGRAEVRITTF
ncbi:MAG: c-type cytochrome [Rhizobiaceae bacterium]